MSGATALAAAPGPVAGAAGRSPETPARPPVPVLRPLRILPALRPLAAGALFLFLVAIQSPRSLWLTEALAFRSARGPHATFAAAARDDDLATAVSQLLARPLALHSSVPEVVRAPGYVLGLLTVLLLGSAARRLGALVVDDWRLPSVARPASMGAAAALLAACHQFLGATAAEVGPYAVTVFAVAAAVDLLLRVVTARHWSTAVLAGVGCGVAAATHVSAAVVVAGALVGLTLLPRRRLPVRQLALAAVLTVAVAAVLLHATLDTSTARTQWLGTPGEDGSVGGSVSLLAGGVAPGAAPAQPGRALSRLATLALLLLIALAVLHLARMVRVTGRSTGTFVLAFPLLLLLAPLALAEVLTLAGVGDAAGRNLVAAAPGVVLLATVELYRSGGPASGWLGFVEWRNGYSAAAVAATGALLGSLLVGIGAVSTLPCVGGACAREQWSTAVAKIETLRTPGDVVVVLAPQTVLPYDLAAARVDLRLKAAGDRPLPRTVWPASLAAGLAAPTTLDARTRGLEVGAAFRATTGATRVWLVLSHDTGTRAAAAEDLDRALSTQFGVRTVSSGVGGKKKTILHRYSWVYRGVTVQLFTHAGAAPTPPLD